MSDDVTSGEEGPTDRHVTRAVVAAAIAANMLIALGAWVYLQGYATLPTRLIGGPFALETGGGKTLTEADLKGHPFLVYFGYTHCPDVCPTTLGQIAVVLGRIPDVPVRVLFITVDPQRDTPAVMADYVSSFDARIVGLSGTIEAIASAEKAYRVYARKGETNTNGEYAMEHSSVVYLMDSNGVFVDAFNLDRSPDEAARELARLP